MPNDEEEIPGSARVSRAGDGVLAVANFHPARKIVFARRKNQHARRARYPEDAVSAEKNFEEKLETWRKEAKHGDVVSGRGVDVANGPIPKHVGYYGETVVRPPVWTWEIPLYFFVGGAAGMAPLLACAGLLFGYAELTRAALWITAAGAIISPILLIMDLGRPSMFLNMLRIFKYQSPMSVGAWILSMFGTCAVPACITYELHFHHIFSGGLDTFLSIVAILLTIGAAFWGIGLATYTGVLIGATVVPAWFLHRVLLPIHFGTAGLGCAVALLLLSGFQMRPLFLLFILTAIIETLLWIWLEIDKHGAADRALHAGRSGWLIRAGEFLCGPLPLVLGLTNLLSWAALSFLLGALLSRFGWISAGRVSGKDPEAVFASQA